MTVEGRIFEIAINQHGMLRRGIERARDEMLQLRVVVHDRHRAPTQHVRRSHEQGIADTRGNRARVLQRTRETMRRLRNVQRLEQRAEPFTIFGEINRIG